MVKKTALLCGIASIVLWSTAPARAAAPDPYQIYANARAYWDNQRYPEYVGYQTVVEVTDGGSTRAERYDSAYDTATGRIWIDPVSDYERQHPASTRGFGFNLSRAPHAAPGSDFIGLPMLAPNYSFSLAHHPPLAAATNPLSDRDIVAQIRAEFHDANPRAKPTPQPPGLREITTVTAYHRDYAITLDGIETVDNTPCYHLSLAPQKDPGTYRLRDVWVDRTTFATVRARTGLNFIDGPGTQMPWQIEFGDIHGARYITSESAQGTYRYDSKRYSEVTIRFENISARASALPIEIAPPAVYLLLTEP